MLPLGHGEVMGDKAVASHGSLPDLPHGARMHYLLGKDALGWIAPLPLLQIAPFNVSHERGSSSL